VADVSRGDQIWNNPYYFYSIKYGTRQGNRIEVKMTVRYPSDDERLPPQANATIGANMVEKQVPDNHDLLDAREFANSYNYDEDEYNYWLELDGNDKIVGGEWITQYDEHGRARTDDRPDYLWVKHRMNFTGDYEYLKYLSK
jgi:hypothetical protein